MCQLSSLAESLTCFICLGLVNDPVSLPCCGQLVCNNCAKKWLLTNTTCPFCRSVLKESDFIHLEWVSKVARLVSLIPKSDSSTCPVHKKQYSFKCKKCNVYLCSECLFDLVTLPESPHKGHEIIKISEVISNLKSEVQKKLACLFDDLDKIIQAGNQLSENVIEFRREFKEAQKLQIESYYTLEKSYKDQMQRTISELETQLESNRDIRKEIVSLLQEISSLKPYHARLAHQKIKATVQKCNSKSFMQRKPITPSKMHITPQLDITTFVFKHFTLTDPIISQTVTLCHNKWRVKIEKNPEATGYLSVFVQSAGLSSKDPARFLLYIRIWNRQRDVSPIERSYITEFCQNDWWGWLKFCPFSLIEDSSLLRDGDLWLDLGIKSTSYRQLMLDTQSEIKAIQEKCRRLQINEDDE